jgi:CIC family chloride channel protein
MIRGEQGDTTTQPNLLRGVLTPRGWLLVVPLGVGTGLATAALMVLLHAVEHVAWSYDSGGLVAAAAQASPTRHVLVLLGAGVLAAVGVALLRRTSGGGEVAKAVWTEDGRMSWWPSVGNGVLSIVVVGLGASLGREAAPQKTGAALASTLCRWARLDNQQRRLLAAAGAGAGMAAVYDVPLGGALFAAEVLLGTLSLPLVLPLLATSVVATGVAWIALPPEPTYSVPTGLVSLPLVIGAVVLGPLAAAASVGWVRLIGWVSAHRPSGWRLVIAPVVVLTAVGAVSIVYPQVLGNGKDLAQQVFLGSGALGTLVVLLVLKPVATAACLGSGTPGGLFTPTLTTGAVLGGVFGHVWTWLWPGAPVGNYALVGAAAMLAAAMRAPVAAVVLLLELTRHLDSLMVPALLAVVTATVVANRFGTRTIYSAR